MCEVCDDTHTDDAFNNSWPAPCALFSALTASTKLERLCLVLPKMPLGGWDFVFPPQRTLSSLTSLTVGAVSSADALSVGFVSSIVRSCPGLCELEFKQDWAGPAVAAFQSLSGLTILKLSMYRNSIAEIRTKQVIQHVTALTALRRLHLRLPRDFNPRQDLNRAELMPLASMTQLTYCCLSHLQPRPAVLHA